MGGIGKTTLARNVYVNQLIVEYFDICAWVIISQDYNVPELLLEVLVNSNKHEIMGNLGNLSGMSEEELGENLYKSLCGRRYLIVMDDMWNIKVWWDKLKFYLPDNNNGSRILITTRLSKLAFHLMGCNGFEMKLLDDHKSWILFSQKVFGEEVCPTEFEEIGKKIAKCCKGLPLSIAVIGGLLAKSERTLQYWEYIAENLNPIVNLEDDAYCLRLLSMSYINLPVHLKSCFLYMGVFPEGKVIRVSSLIKLWVAEGFLKSISGNNLEVVARDYLKDLMDRNLILEHKWGHSGKIKFCKIHDLLRDLCLREAQKEKLFCVPKGNSPDSLQCLNTQRRIVVHPSTSNEEYSYQLLHGLQSSSIARSVICNFQGHLPLLNCRLLRVLKDHDNTRIYIGPSGKDEYFLKDILQLVNLRYFTVSFGSNLNLEFPSSMCLLWNLQTLIVQGIHELVVAPPEIWQMPQLRHLQLRELYLPDPPSVEEDKPVLVLRNLQTLFKIKNFKCGEDVINRIPNIKKLGVLYEGPDEGSRRDSLINLGRLTNLESFSCAFNSTEMPFLQNITFPRSLRKLTLQETFLDWEEMSTTIGSLPLLQVLKLRSNACKGPKWEPVEGQFCNLKFLLVDEYYQSFGLAYWMADETNFPCLEQLVLEELRNLKEVPSGIGDIPTLRSIELNCCSNSAVISVKKIVDEQVELGNVDLQVQVLGWGEFLASLASRNFRVVIVSYDNWERLVEVVLRREYLWQLFHAPSISSIESDMSSSSSFSLDHPFLDVSLYDTVKSDEEFESSKHFEKKS